MSSRDLNYYNNRLRIYWETVKVVSLKNLKLRYRNSILGFFWTLINPLFTLSIFIFVFSKVIGGIPNYELYVVTGLLFWNFFTSSSAQIINKILESGGILKSINIPPIIFPLSALGANLINFLLSFIVFFALMLFYGIELSWVTLLIIPATLLFTVFTFAFSMILSSLNVFFRDIEMFWSTILPALFYATPVVYDVSQTPNLIKYMNFNPFYHFMNLFRAILYSNEIPSSFTLGITCIITFITLLISIFIYNKLKKGFISNF